MVLAKPHQSKPPGIFMEDTARFDNKPGGTH